MVEEKALNDQMMARRQKLATIVDDLHLDPFGKRFRSKDQTNEIQTH